MTISNAARALADTTELAASEGLRRDVMMMTFDGLKGQIPEEYLAKGAAQILASCAGRSAAAAMMDLSEADFLLVLPEYLKVVEHIAKDARKKLKQMEG